MSTTLESTDQEPDSDLHPEGPAGRLVSLRQKAAQTALPAAFIVSVIVTWEVWVRTAEVPQFLLPAPTDIFDTLVASWGTGLATDARITLLEALIGFTGGCLLGFVLAIAITYSKILERMIYPIIVSAQATPKIALAPLFVVWLGFGMAPKVMVTILLVFFPIVITTAHGLKSVDPSLLELLRSVSANRWQIFRKVRLPNALPHVFSGMKIAITLAVIGAVVGEWVGANAGLGYRIIYAKSQLQTTLTFAAIAVLIAMGIVLFIAVSVLGNVLTPWTSEDEQQMFGGL